MILELDNLTKLYNNGRGAEDISFALEPGEVLGLLGPNGSGKTFFTAGSLLFDKKEY